jgi:hypothetical protein
VQYSRAERDRCTTCGAKTGISGHTQCGACHYGTPPRATPRRKDGPRRSIVRPPGLEPGQPSRTTATSRQRVYLIPSRAHGVAPRCRPGSSAVRRRSRKPCAAASLPGLESNQRRHGPEPCWAADSPPGTVLVTRPAHAEDLADVELVGCRSPDRPRCHGRDSSRPVAPRR